MIYQPLACAVKGLDILLFERLLRHEAHVSLLLCSTDRLCIIRIVFLAPHERLHILWRHDLTA